MKSNDDYFDVLDIVAGKDVMPKPDLLGCKLGGYT